MKNFILLFAIILLTNCITQKPIKRPPIKRPPIRPVIRHVRPPIRLARPPVKRVKPKIIQITRYYSFCDQIKKIEGKLFDKRYKHFLRDGKYAIDINNGLVATCTNSGLGDVTKKGEIKDSKYFGEWKYVYKKDTVKTENYKEGVLHGIYKIFNSNKKLIYDKFY